MIALCILLAALCGDIGLPASDIPAYKQALERPKTDAPEVSFRQLWDAPEAHRGKAVKVRGTIVRSFRAGPSGELPARLEIWIATPSGDLICAVAPDASNMTLPTSEITFHGTSLGIIQYQSGDVMRMAPLVVGPVSPEASPRLAATVSKFGSLTVEGLLGMIVALGVATILMRNSRGRPLRRPQEPDLPLEFVDTPRDEGEPDGT